MCKVKYPSTFSRQMEVIVFVILQIFFAAHADGEYHSDIQSCEAFRPIMCKRKYLIDYKLRYFRLLNMLSN